jgi:hypothetical protein
MNGSFTLRVYFTCRISNKQNELLFMILWRNRPMRELLKFRNLKERNCATVVERCRAAPCLPSLPLACASTSVARRRLVETVNPSACAAVNCELCK